jgi:hypothetical protein
VKQGTNKSSNWHNYRGENAHVILYKNSFRLPFQAGCIC